MNAAFNELQRPHPPLERFIPNPKLKFMEQCRKLTRAMVGQFERICFDWNHRPVAAGLIQSAK